MSDRVGPRVLVLDDSGGVPRDTLEYLRREGVPVAVHTSLDLGVRALEAEEFDLVLTGAVSHLANEPLWRRIHQERPDLPVILVVPEADPTSIARWREDGVADVLMPGDPIDAMLERAMAERLRRTPLRLLPRTDAAAGAFDELVGSSPAMQALRRRLRQIAVSGAPVLLIGETGTGKELVGRALHRHGPRRESPFVGINCAAIPVGLLESELFGHERGAFTSAAESRFGLFATAQGGTLLLDEIQAMPLELQPKLLRVLEDRVVRPLGSQREIRFDARLIAASNRDLHAEARAGRFRSDLLYRIDVLRVELPPLRDRGEDVVELAETYLRRVADRAGKEVEGWTPAATEALLQYRWPGNVRELMHVVEAAVALTAHRRVHLDDLPDEVRHGVGSGVRLREGDLATLDEMRHRYARRVLDALGGNKAEAARVLGVSRQTLYRLLR